MIGPVVYTILALIVAGIVHISTIMAMPWLATRDGFARLSSIARDNEIALINPVEARSIVPYSDPSVAMAVCRYVLDKGPVRVRANVGPTALSVLFIRRGIGVFQSLSDRAATQGILDIVIASPEQVQKITALDSDDEPVQEIRVVSSDDTGLVLVKAIVPTDSTRGDIEALVSSATCESESLEK